MLNLVRIWILLSTLLVASGWILSALHELNRAGYGIVFALAAIAVIIWQRKTKWRPTKNFPQLAKKFKKRFRHFAPALFLVLIVGSILGGALYPCTDLDSNAYRLPRVLHWLGQEQWHWIHTDDYRMNIAATGFEWLSAPLILFTHTDRVAFLPNLVSFLMLPGLIFSLFFRLGVRPRVAWWWMWLLSAGWCYATQAGSFHNDSFAVIYALAAVGLALRAREKWSVYDLWLSALAAGLLAGAKQTNIPLVLLWIIAALPSVRLFAVKPIMTTAVAIITLLISAAPVIIFNFVHVGNWTGIPEGSHWARAQLHSPFWGIMGNAFALPAQNLLPPFFPWSNAWDDMMARFVKTGFGLHFTGFEHFGYLNPGITEKNAGIGLGVFIFTIVSLFAGWRLPVSRPAGIVTVDKITRLLRWAPVLLLLLFMAMVGAFQNARLLSPYYVFLFPLLLSLPGQSGLTRKGWWRWTGLLTMVLTLFTLMLIRSRPLFPAVTIFESLYNAHPHSKVVAQGWKSYSNRLSLESVRNCFKDSIPPEEKIIGYATFEGAAEPALWMPLGCREVKRVMPLDGPEQLSRSNIHYVVVEDLALEKAGETIGQWTAKYNGTVVDQFNFQYDPYRAPTGLYLVRLNPSPQR
ncbi:MAG TPA: hypothetical protein VFV23_04235 [Verrucomicrobiae bacterium]|nr:hypothetical protein [Verrucomicrobiae bacterium]